MITNLLTDTIRLIIMIIKVSLEIKFIIHDQNWL